MKSYEKQLKKVTQIFKDMDLETVYIYDDLVLPSQNRFILKREEDKRKASLFFNAAYNKQTRVGLENTILKAAQECSLDIVYPGRFNLSKLNSNSLI